MVQSLQMLSFEAMEENMKKKSTVRYWVCDGKACTAFNPHWSVADILANHTNTPGCHWKKERNRYYQKDLSDDNPYWESCIAASKCIEAKEVTEAEFLLESI